MKNILVHATMALVICVLPACTTADSMNNPANPQASATGNTQRYTNQGGHTDSAPNPQY